MRYMRPKSRLMIIIILIIIFSTTSVVASSTSTHFGEARSVEEIKKEINLKLNIGNHAVREEGRRLILEYPGDGTISQICSIYDYMVGNWSYARDTRGIEEFQYSNESLLNRHGKFSGQGDCDDFAILMASLIESIGGTSRIVLAYGPTGGHAYTEVYLGKAKGVDSDVERMIKWLKARYNVSEIKTHNDMDTGDVWLNLDWWIDPNNGAELTKHPGGPFFKATTQTPILIREDVPKEPLEPLNDPPIALFLVSPTGPNAEENVTFDASSSRDIGIGGGIERYLWNFGDGRKGEGKIVTHAYSQGDRYQVDLTVIDNDGARNGTVQTVEVNSLPVPIIDYQPKEPKIGDIITFDASKSWDKEDRKVFKWQWEFGDGDTSIRMNPSHPYLEEGNCTINLTVIDSDGARNKSYLVIRINRPPIARFSFEPRMPNQGSPIRFDGSDSSDLDGKIIDYEWDFGDANNQTGPLAEHSYAIGGNFLITLVVKDNNNATNAVSSRMRVNRVPSAIFNSSPEEPSINERVVIDASKSNDPDGKVVHYAWNLDGQTYEGPKINTVFSQPGPVNVSLVVTDENGTKGAFSKPLTVIEKEWNFYEDLNGWNRTGYLIKDNEDLTKKVLWLALSWDAFGLVLVDGCHENGVGIEKNIRLSKKAKLLHVTALKGGLDGGIRFIINDSEGPHIIGSETLSGNDKRTFSYDISGWAGETILLQIKGFGYGTNKTTECEDPDCCGEYIGVDKVEIT
jgi:PKD repeat protein